MTELVRMVQTLLDHLKTLPGLVGLLIAGVLLLVVGLNVREALRLKRLTNRVRTRVEPSEPGGQSPMEPPPCLAWRAACRRYADGSFTVHRGQCGAKL